MANIRHQQSFLGSSRCIEPYCNKLEISNATMFCLDEIAQYGTRCRATCNSGFRVQAANPNARADKIQSVQVTRSFYCDDNIPTTDN